MVVANVGGWNELRVLLKLVEQMFTALNVPSKNPDLDDISEGGRIGGGCTGIAEEKGRFARGVRAGLGGADGGGNGKWLIGAGGGAKTRVGPITSSCV